jgi:hypothetical protein
MPESKEVFIPCHIEKKAMLTKAPACLSARPPRCIGCRDAARSDEQQEQDDDGDHEQGVHRRIARRARRLVLVTVVDRASVVAYDAATRDAARPDDI